MRTGEVVSGICIWLDEDSVSTVQAAATAATKAPFLAPTTATSLSASAITRRVQVSLASVDNALDCKMF